jgi:hypothetical protein
MASIPPLPRQLRLLLRPSPLPWMRVVVLCSMMSLQVSSMRAMARGGRRARASRARGGRGRCQKDSCSCRCRCCCSSPSQRSGWSTRNLKTRLLSLAPRQGYESVCTAATVPPDAATAAQACHGRDTAAGHFVDPKVSSETPSLSAVS